MDVVVSAALCLVEACAAREYEIGEVEQLGLALGDVIRSEGKRRQLVHAVVDNRERPEPPRVVDSHRRVEPEHEAPELAGELLQEACLFACHSVWREAGGKVRGHERHALPPSGSLESCRAFAGKRLLDEDNASLPGEPAF